MADGRKAKPGWFLLLLFAQLCTHQASAQAHTNVQTVFLIVMENVSWSEIKGSTNAPYINTTLLPLASRCEWYFSPTGVASSLPNYIILEGGTNFGITASPLPSQTTPIASTNHLVSQLNNAGISWKSYQEGISGTGCPTNNTGLYVAWHNPFLYFKDLMTNAAYCIAQNRPYTEFAGHLQSNAVSRYNFIVPNLCHDMHGDNGCPAGVNRITLGDSWFATEIPRIMNSQAYSNNGAIFITWDESTLPPTLAPVGMLVLSPLAKGGGYFNTNYFNHNSTLRTMQEIFGVRPFLGAAATATSLSDLFRPTIFLRSGGLTNGQFQMTFTGINPGKTNFIQASTSLTNWSSIRTNIATTNTLTYTDATATNFNGHFYRVVELP